MGVSRASLVLLRLLSTELLVLARALGVLESLAMAARSSADGGGVWGLTAAETSLFPTLCPAAPHGYHIDITNPFPTLLTWLAAHPWGCTGCWDVKRL